MTKIVSDSFNTLEALYNTRVSLESIGALVKKTGRPEDKIAEMIISKYLLNWSEKLAEDLELLSGSNPKAGNFSMLYSISKSFVSESVKVFMDTGSLNKYTIMVGCELSIYYLCQTLNYLTSIVSRSTFINRKEYLRKSLSEETFKILDDATELSLDVQNAIKKKGLTEETAATMIKKYSKFWISQSDAQSYEEIYNDFSSRVSSTVMSFIMDNSFFIKEYDLINMIDIINKRPITEDEILMYFENIVNDKIQSISLFDDLKDMYVKAIGGYKSEFYRDDISSIPIEILCEVIFLKEPTIKLKEFLDEEKQIKTTGEF